jgi:transcriptional regulator with XRE-family HTH domain
MRVKMKAIKTDMPNLRPDPQKVRELRRKHPWSQEELAKASDVSARTIQRIESGGAASIETVRALASVFSVEPEDLLVQAETEPLAGHEPRVEMLRLLAEERFLTGHRERSRELKSRIDRLAAEAGMNVQKFAVLAFRVYEETVSGWVRERIAAYKGVAQEYEAQEMLSAAEVGRFRGDVERLINVWIGSLRHEVERRAAGVGTTFGLPPDGRYQGLKGQLVEVAVHALKEAELVGILGFSRRSPLEQGTQRPNSSAIRMPSPVSGEGDSMTLSANDRHKNMDVALRLMLDYVGDEGSEHVFIESNTAAFAAVLPTTWQELLRRELVRPSSRYYLLTGEGWLKAMGLAGRLDDEFDGKISKLCAFLKQKVKGRLEKGLVELSEIARSTGLSKGWVFNAIDSRVLARRYNMIEAYWLPGDQMKNYVEIPPDFGMKRL